MVGDLIDGRGLSEAIDGADTIIHCASDPNASGADLQAADHLLAAARAAGSPNIIYISIVGSGNGTAWPAEWSTAIPSRGCGSRRRIATWVTTSLRFVSAWSSRDVGDSPGDCLGGKWNYGGGGRSGNASRGSSRS